MCDPAQELHDGRMKKQLLAVIFCGLVVFVACKRDNEEAPEAYNASLNKPDGPSLSNSVLNKTNMLIAAPEK